MDVLNECKLNTIDNPKEHLHHTMDDLKKCLPDTMNVLKEQTPRSYHEWS